MALARPTLLNVAPFDAMKSYVFEFQSSWGSTNITANTLVIKRNDNLNVVYNQRQTTFAYQHILPENTLTNGVVYQATIQTFGADGSQSVPSLPIVFYCLNTPTFEFINIPSGNRIPSNSFSFNLVYNQSNGELLNSVIFNLYSASGALLSTSGSLNNFSTIPAEIQYLFSGFEDNTEYYIEATGQTERGMSITTGKIRLLCDYEEVDFFSVFSLSNNCDGGYITISSSAVAVDGESNPSPPIYINNEAVDLTATGSWVNFSRGYNINDDFTMKIWGRSFNLNSEILNIYSSDGANIVVEYKSDDNQNVYLELVVTSNGIKYLTNSNTISIPSSSDEIFILLRRIDDVYQINLVNRGVVA